MGTSPGFILNQVPSPTQWNQYFSGKADDYPVSHVVVTDGETLASIPGQGTLVLDPAAPLNSLIIVTPPGPINQQKFTIVTTQAINAVTVTTTAGLTILGGSFGMGANSAAAWQFLVATNTWYRIQ